jgi:glycosyltransferase involved in cell wall biosynthesis
MLRRVDAIITDSECSQRDIAHYLQVPKEKITVTMLAAARHFRVLSQAESAPALARAGVAPPYILYVGSLEPRKNLLRLLEAYRLVREWSPRWGLVIVGARNAWKSTPVAAAVERYGLQDNVTFTGYVPDEDLPALYNGAGLFCFPSLYEGFGLPVLEAMACGAPVVTSNTSSLPEVAGEAALLVDPYDVEAIAAAMQRVLSEPELAEDLRRRGLARAAEFTWERTARETIAVYERVLEAKPG